MALSPGFRLGPYSIVSELGKGGMGEVYRARDTRLNRDVAIKVLPDHMVEDPDALRSPHRSIKSLVIATVLVAFVAAGLFYFFAMSRKPVDSLAILPFDNVGGDPNMEYLSDGITESLINNLSQLPQLRVMARTTVFTYKNRDVDPRKVGQELGVRAVLTGKLTRMGDTLVVQGELVNAADGSQLWGEHYSRKITDILALQEKIAKEIADKLKYRLTGEQERMLEKHFTENTAAYQVYLKGRYFWNKRTPEDLQKSTSYFQQAIDKDPNYALAYAGLADVYTRLAIISDVAPKESFPKAKAAIAKALELDETLVEAHATMMYIKSNYDWDWQAVESEFQRAMQINPNYPPAHETYGGFLNKMGRQSEAIAELKRAQELDPLSLIGNTLLARAYLVARRYDQAIEQCRKTLEIDPNFFGARVHLGRAYAARGMYQQAIDELSKASDVTGLHAESISVIGYIYAVTGKRAEAQRILDELKQRSTQRYVSPYHIAMVYAGLGEKDQAFEWLQKAYEDRSVLLSFINGAPEFDKFHSDPRYSDLLHRLNLTQ